MRLRRRRIFRVKRQAENLVLVGVVSCVVTAAFALLIAVHAHAERLAGIPAAFMR
jgi:hypothetical protein